MNTKMLPQRWLSVALCALLTSSVAFAKDDPKKKKDAAPDHKGGMMEEGGKDPAETETLEEDGAFVPGKKKKPAKKAEGETEGEEGAAGDEGESAEDRALNRGKPPPKEEEKPKERKPPKARKTLGVFAEGLIGFGAAPVPGPGDPDTGKSTSFGILIGGHYDLTTSLRLSLRLPWTTGTVPSAAGKDISTNALGVPEMAARYRITEPGDTELAVKLAVGIPAAQGNPNFTDVRDATGLAQARLQRVADAANGYHDPELYAPKRLPVTPSVTVSHRMDALRVGGELKLVIMPKVGGSKLPSVSGSAAAGGTPTGTFEEKSTALSVIIGGNAGYEFLEKKFIALAAWAMWRPADQIEYSSNATPPSRVQFVMEPRLIAQFGHFVPMVGFLIPLGGELGGKINGVRLHVDAVF